MQPSVKFLAATCARVCVRVRVRVRVRVHVRGRVVVLHGAAPKLVLVLGRGVGGGPVVPEPR